MDGSPRGTHLAVALSIVGVGWAASPELRGGARGTAGDKPVAIEPSLTELRPDQAEAKRPIAAHPADTQGTGRWLANMVKMPWNERVALIAWMVAWLDMASLMWVIHPRFFLPLFIFLMLVLGLFGVSHDFPSVFGSASMRRRILRIPRGLLVAYGTGVIYESVRTQKQGGLVILLLIGVGWVLLTHEIDKAQEEESAAKAEEARRWSEDLASQQIAELRSLFMHHDQEMRQNLQEYFTKMKESDRPQAAGRVLLASAAAAALALSFSLGNRHRSGSS